MNLSKVVQSPRRPSSARQFQTCKRHKTKEIFNFHSHSFLLSLSISGSLKRFEFKKYEFHVKYSIVFVQNSLDDFVSLLTSEQIQE